MNTLKKLEHFSNISFDYIRSGLQYFEAENPLFVLDSVAYVFNISIPLNSIAPVTVIFDTSREHPTCYRVTHEIYLKVRPQSWSQIAYQFAHELCHYVIPNDVTTTLAWLEESICELSSYYFLPKISKYWKRLGVQLLTDKNELYYPCFTTYVEDDCKKAIEFDLSKFSDNTSPDLLELSNNCTLRKKNAHIANNLLPIFKKNPKTWHAIPFLCLIRPNQDISSSLKEWIVLSPPESRNGLVEVARVFGVSESLL